MANEIELLKKDIQNLKDTIAKMERTYKDLLYNLDDDNMSETLISEKSGMKASIKVTAESIESEVTNRENADVTLQSNITQTAESITSQVKRVFSGTVGTYLNNISPYYPPIGSDKTKMWQNTYFTGTNKRYYFYNDIKQDWDYTLTPSISSLFTQTATGFELSGTVKISGDLITSGTISANRISTAGLGAEKIYQPSYPNNYGVIGGSYSDFIMYYANSEYFRVKNNLNGEISLVNDGYTFLNTGGTTTYAYGNWNFQGSVSGVDAVFA